MKIFFDPTWTPDEQIRAFHRNAALDRSDRRVRFVSWLAEVFAVVAAVVVVVLAAVGLGFLLGSL